MVGEEREDEDGPGPGPGPGRAGTREDEEVGMLGISSWVPGTKGGKS